jgi:hypothetical protein
VATKKRENKKGHLQYPTNHSQREREGSSLTSKNAQNATKAIHAMPTQRAAVSNKPLKNGQRKKDRKKGMVPKAKTTFVHHPMHHFHPFLFPRSSSKS